MSKLQATYVSDIERDEKYAEIYSVQSDNERIFLCEILFQDIDTEDLTIKLGSSIQYKLSDFLSFLQKSGERLIKERPPKGQRRAEDIVWDEDKSETKNKV